MSVHNTHCCKKHGCKYRDDDCPVEFSDEEGIRCEDCYYDSEENKNKSVYIVSNSATGVVYGWLEDEWDFDHAKKWIIETYGVNPNLLELVGNIYLGR